MLYHFNDLFAEARMYQNRHGRFTAVDPLLASGKSANPQTFNRYVYVINNPIILVDPDGLQVSFVPSGGTPLVPNGRWYKPIFPDGVQTYRFEASQPDGYEPVTQRNRNGDLIGEYVGGFVGLLPYYVLRFNEMGPMTPLPLLDVRTGQTSRARLTDSELNGFDVIPGPEFKHTGAVQNAIEPYDVALLGNPFRFIGSRALSRTQSSSTGVGTTAATETVPQIRNTYAFSTRAFHSGPGSQEAAIASGYRTLGQTRAGQNLQKLIDRNNIPWSRAERMWERLSVPWARGVPDGASVKVFLNSPRKNAVWYRIERPILESKNVRICEVICQ